MLTWRYGNSYERNDITLWRGNPPDAVHRWVRKNFKTLFEAELDGWYCDPDLWPKNLTFKLFQSWFDIECHTVLVDTVGGSIFDDET